ncbi:hypothetical protein GE061_001162 [Apolygus lucorum]|uniref:Uncharacterized protein n=1 Tax=Apolygus lucorum TaxID=248454 RepID=A0A8S9Y6A0_APOLU|nr:hypothetical protein GE061_001162 [Apolygus lucorum]
MPDANCRKIVSQAFMIRGNSAPAAKTMISAFQMQHMRSNKYLCFGSRAEEHRRPYHRTRMRKEVREKWKCDKCVGTKAKENDDKDDVGADKETQNKMDLNQKMDMLLSKFDSFQEKQDSFEASMDFFNSCFEDMKERFEDFKTELDEIKENQSILQNENVSLKEEVENLKLKVNDLDQLSLSTSVEIKGIPETHNENVLEIVKTLAVGENLAAKFQEVTNPLDEGSDQFPRGNSGFQIPEMEECDLLKLIRDMRVEVSGPAIPQAKETGIFVFQALQPSFWAMEMNCREPRRNYLNIPYMGKLGSKTRRAEKRRTKKGREEKKDPSEHEVQTRENSQEAILT